MTRFTVTTTIDTSEDLGDVRAEAIARLGPDWGGTLEVVEVPPTREVRIDRSEGGQVDWVACAACGSGDIREVDHGSRVNEIVDVEEVDGLLRVDVSAGDGHFADGDWSCQGCHTAVRWPATTDFRYGR